MPRAMDNHLDLKFLAIGDSGVGKVGDERQRIRSKPYRVDVPAEPIRRWEVPHHYGNDGGHRHSK